MPCPQCNLPLKVPELRFKEVRCEHCIRRGRDGRILAGYFPLGEALLEHLRRTDPLRGAIERLSQEADKHNQRLLESRAREVANTIDATRDDYPFISGIKQVGFTGNTKVIHRSRM